MTLQMYTSLSGESPIATIILSSNCPARPTKGIPCASSSDPGASPTMHSPAIGFPRKNTVLVRVLDKPHRVHARTCSSRTSSLCFLASSSSGGGSSVVGTAGASTRKEDDGCSPAEAMWTTGPVLSTVAWIGVGECASGGELDGANGVVDSGTIGVKAGDGAGRRGSPLAPVSDCHSTCARSIPTMDRSSSWGSSNMPEVLPDVWASVQWSGLRIPATGLSIPPLVLEVRRTNRGATG